MDWENLLRVARKNRLHAYAPYSNYSVGAALLDDLGEIHGGCNVENISFGATICAERIAMGKMISSGGRRVQAIVVVTEDGGYPCGICLQCLAEFRPWDGDIQVMVVGLTGSTVYPLCELMPHAFKFLRKGTGE